MNARDRLNRSAGRIVTAMGEAVVVNGQPVTGLFEELDDRDSIALGVVQGDPKRRATLALLPTTAAGLNVRTGSVQAGGTGWKIVPPRGMRDGLVCINLEHAP